MRYMVMIDDNGAGAYGVAFPDLPGCVAMGDTIEDAMADAGEALREWADDFTRDGGAMPEPRTAAAIVAKAEYGDELRAGRAQLASVALVRSTGRPARANMTLDQGVLAAIDAAAVRRKVTRSAMVEIMAREFLPAAE